MENDEERKQTSRRVPFTELNQVSSDFAAAMALQEQERAFTVLSTIESESSDVDGSDDDETNHSDEETYDQNDYEYFEGHQSHEFEAELEFLEGEGSNDPSDDEMEDDYGIDVDELTYEELIALGEFIGEEKRGLSLNDISKCLQPCKYCSTIERKSGIERCVICQVEYEEGEAVVALHCDHPYHSDCISNWLQVKKICPICSTEVSPSKIAKTV